MIINLLSYTSIVICLLLNILGKQPISNSKQSPRKEGKKYYLPKMYPSNYSYPFFLYKDIIFRGEVEDNVIMYMLASSKGIAKNFFRDSARKGDYEANVLHMGNEYINLKKQGFTKSETMVKIATASGYEPRTRIDSLITFHKGYTERRSTFLNDMTKHNIGINTNKMIVNGQNTKTNMMFVAEAHHMNKAESLIPYEKTLFSENDPAYINSKADTGQSHCDGKITLNYISKETGLPLQWEQGIDIKLGKANINHHCTLTTIIVDEEKQELYGILNDPVSISEFFQGKKKIFESFHMGQKNNRFNNDIVDSYSKEINNVLTTDLPVVEKINLISEMSIHFKGILIEQKIPHYSFNPQFYSIDTVKRIQHIQHNSRGEIIDAHNRADEAFSSMKNRNKIYGTIISQDRNLALEYKELKGNKVWEPSFIDDIYID